MKKLNMISAFKSIQRSLDKHSPEIIMGIGIAGMATTVVLAVKATPKAIELIEIEKARQNRELVKEAAEKGQPAVRQITKLKPSDVIKVTWKCYIPAVISGISSIACLMGANSIKSRRQVALATAYKLSETAFTEYKDKVIETIGEEQEKVVRDKVAEEKIKKNPVSKNEMVIVGKGEYLCYDAISGRYFKSDKENIRRAINEINNVMVNEMYASLNDFYCALDVPELNCIKIGDELGWKIDNGLIDVNFSSQLASDGTPCLVMDYRIAPKYDFNRFL